MTRTALLACTAFLALVACDQTTTDPVTPPPAPAPAPTPDPTPTPPEPVPATTLAEINATPCGPLTTGTTATVAEVASATEVETTSRVRPQMIAGTSAALADLPGIAKLEPERDLSPSSVSKGHCSATRIAEDWFITAAHCVDEDYDRLTIRVGHEVLSSPITARTSADYAVCHSAYGGREGGYANDIALLRVPGDTLPEIGTPPIVRFGELSASFSPVNFPEARIGGWGTTSFGGDLSDYLQKADLDVDGIGAAVISLNSRDGKGPCVGDSGGPLFVQEGEDYVLMGVLSTVAARPGGQVCQGDYVATYTNLSGYSDWIENVIATCEDDAGKCQNTAD